MTIVVTALGLLLVATASVFIVWPLLGGGVAAASTPAASAGEVSMAHAEAAREAALAAIREAEFDHRIGKLSDEDHAILRVQLENEALRAIETLDALCGALPAAIEDLARGEPGGARAAAAPSTAAAYCAGCGRRTDSDARFCAGCGAPAPKPGRRSRGRR